MVLEALDLVKFGLDKIFPDEAKRMQAQAVLDEIQSSEVLSQIDVNRVEAAHKSVFVAGWRPFAGWVCGLGFVAGVFVRPVILSFGVDMPPVPLEMIMPIWAGLIGLRSWEKTKGVAS